MKKQKLTLSELKVKSFITNEVGSLQTIRGGSETASEFDGGEVDAVTGACGNGTTGDVPSAPGGGGGTAMTANCTQNPCGPFHDQ